MLAESSKVGKTRRTPDPLTCGGRSTRDSKQAARVASAEVESLSFLLALSKELNEDLVVDILAGPPLITSKGAFLGWRWRPGGAGRGEAMGEWLWGIELEKTVVNFSCRKVLCRI